MLSRKKHLQHQTLVNTQYLQRISLMSSDTQYLDELLPMHSNRDEEVKQMIDAYTQVLTRKDITEDDITSITQAFHDLTKEFSSDDVDMDSRLADVDFTIQIILFLGKVEDRLPDVSATPELLQGAFKAEIEAFAVKWGTDSDILKRVKDVAAKLELQIQQGDFDNE